MDAICALGCMYENGKGGYICPPKALKLYEQAADAGNALAMYYHGNVYYNGTHAGKDESKACEWYQKAFELYERSARIGYPRAMKNLADAYHYGLGVEKDLIQAFNWYYKAHTEDDDREYVECCLKVYREIRDEKESDSDDVNDYYGEEEEFGSESEDEDNLKTVTAYLAADLLYSLGIVKTNKVVKVSSEQLIGKYIGYTAPQIREWCRKAYDGILFIDEAYLLAEHPSLFADFSTDELCELFVRKFAKMDFTVEQEALNRLMF